MKKRIVIAMGLVFLGMLAAGTVSGQAITAEKVLKAEKARADRLMDEGKYQEVLLLRQRLADAATKLYGRDSVETMKYQDDLGDILTGLRQYAKAEPLYLRGLQIREAQLGKDHLDVAYSLLNLAVLYEMMGQYPKAEPLHLRSLQIREAKLGKDHPLVALSLHNLGTLSEATAQTVQATDWIDRARRLLRRHITRVLTALSEPEQLNFLRNTDETAWHIALSLGLRHPDDDTLAERSVAWLLNGKGVAQQTLAQTALLARDRHDPNLRDLSQRSHQTRQELARLTLQPPPEQQLQQRQRRLKELSDQEQDLAKQLRQAGGASDDESWVELGRLRKALPEDGVLI
jgi:tetratricopeptide (TPR) repeat protein